MKLLFSFSLTALLGLGIPAQAELRCKCDHIPIEPKQCVNLCFGVLLNNLSPQQMESVLGLDIQLSNDIVAARNTGPIRSISDLRSQLPEDAFERLEPKIEAAASGHTQEQALLREQLATLAPPMGAVMPDGTWMLTGDQIAALDDEAERERPSGTYTDSDTGMLPATASGMPLLGVMGFISLTVSLALQSFRKQFHPGE